MLDVLEERRIDRLKAQLLLRMPLTEDAQKLFDDWVTNNGKIKDEFKLKMRRSDGENTNSLAGYQKLFSRFVPNTFKKERAAEKKKQASKDDKDYTVEFTIKFVLFNDDGNKKRITKTDQKMVLQWYKEQDVSQHLGFTSAVAFYSISTKINELSVLVKCKSKNEPDETHAEMMADPDDDVNHPLEIDGGEWMIAGEAINVEVELV